MNKTPINIKPYVFCPFPKSRNLAPYIAREVTNLLEIWQEN